MKAPQRLLTQFKLSVIITCSNWKLKMAQGCRLSPIRIART